MSNWKVYIADDQTLFRKGMARLVKSFELVSEVREAENGEELLKLVKQEAPDVVLMDLEMPVMDGIEATERLIAKYPDVKVIVLSMHDTHQHIYYMMEIGAHAFLLKNAEPEEVEEAISSVVERDFYNNDLVSKALRMGAMNKHKADLRPLFKQSASLSDREKEVLMLICRELTMKEIGEKLSLSEKTIQNHRARIMAKLGAKNTVGMVKYAYESGLIE
ncbi:MAG: response regulator transcription factor [Bacteroidota bacterium]